jgi:hypothetical protein
MTGSRSVELVPARADGSDRARTVFRRLRLVAALMVVVAGVDLVSAFVGSSPIPSVVGFGLAVVLLAVVLELGVVLFTTGEGDRVAR